MKLFGHPIHIMLVHFPAALLPMEWLCALMAFTGADHGFALASFYAMFLGCALGWVAMIFGTFDLIDVYESRNNDAMKTALWHGGINTLVLTGYSIIAWIAWKQYPDPGAATLPGLIIRFLLNALMLLGNYFGGKLILTHKIGVHE
jgi:uncharacterized membrane protein